MRIVRILVGIPLVAIVALAGLIAIGAVFKISVPVTYFAEPVMGLLLPDDIRVDLHSVRIRPGKVTEFILVDCKIQYTGPHHPDLELEIGSMEFDLSIDRLVEGEIRVRDANVKDVEGLVSFLEDKENVLSTNPEMAPQGLEGAPTMPRLNIHTMNAERVRIAFEGDDNSLYEFVADQISASAPWEDELRLAMAGNVGGESFELKIGAAPLREWHSALSRGEPENKGSLPFWLDSTIATSEVSVTGTIEPDGTDPVTSMIVDARGDSNTDLHYLYESLPFPPASYSLQLETELRNGRVEVENLDLRTGNSKLDGYLMLENTGSLLRVDVSANLNEIDMDFLAKRDDEQPDMESQPTDTGENQFLDLPVLGLIPKSVDVNSHLRISQIRNTTLELKDLEFNLKVLQDRELFTSVNLNAGGTPMNGEIRLDLAETPPLLEGSLNAQTLEVGKYLSRNNISRDLDLYFEQTKVSFRGRGHTAGEMLDSMEITARTDEGHFDFVGSGGVSEKLDLSTVELNVSYGQRGSLTGVGTIFGEAWNMEVTSPALLPPPKDDNFPIEVMLSKPGATVAIHGSLELPLTSQSLSLDFSIVADNLQSLEGIFENPLPDVSPLVVSGKASYSQGALDIDNFVVEIGDSQVSGNIRSYEEEKSRVTGVALVADRLQFADFTVFDEVQDEEVGNTVGQNTEWEGPRDLFNLFGEGVTSLKIEVLNSYLGEERLGSGNINLTISPDLIEIAEFNIEQDTRDAYLDGSAYIEKEGESYLWKLRAQANDLEYGVIERLENPDTTLGGHASFDLELVGGGSGDDIFWSNSSGHLLFLIMPRELRTDVLDLWAINLLNVLAPRLEKSNEPIVNCFRGDMELSDGIMTPKSLLLDTQRIRVRISGVIDFVNQKLNLRLRPRAKRAQFLSLATPVRLSGSFSDAATAVSGKDVLDTAFRLATEVITVPARWISGSTLPADGEDVCVMEF